MRDSAALKEAAKRVLYTERTTTITGAPGARPLQLTEYGNAERLVQQHGEDLRYCHAYKKWFVWDGIRWCPDATAAVERMAKQTVRAINLEAAQALREAANDQGTLANLPEANVTERKVLESRIQQARDRAKAISAWAKKSERAAQIAAMLKLAESESGVPVSPLDLDRNRYLFNVKNGTINLRTGELQPHTRGDLITKLAPVDYDPAAKCPRWEKFLGEVFESSLDVMPFIQRAAGYSLTGDTSEECLLLMYGTGRNGKGTFIKTMAASMGDYAGTADFSTFVHRRNDTGPRDDVANMKGKHFIAAQESQEGAGLAESLIKWLTGGDLIRARLLYENSSEFDPTHKIWLATNYKPVIRGTDEGIWSRIKLIPFAVSFEGREDKGLKAALMGELPGILTWAVEGCLRWQEEGLDFPDSVVNATREYRSESDQVGRFIEECCVTSESFSGKGRSLYGKYRGWAEEAGDDVLTETAFGRRLAERGFRKKHTSAGNLYEGIGLKIEGVTGSMTDDGL